MDIFYQDAKDIRKPKLSTSSIWYQRRNSRRPSSAPSIATLRLKSGNWGWRAAALNPEIPKSPSKTLVSDILKKRSHQYHGYDPVLSTDEGHDEIQILITNERMNG